MAAASWQLLDGELPAGASLQAEPTRAVAPARDPSVTGAADAYGCPCTIFSPTSVPVQYLNISDSQPLELGTKFRSITSGQVTALRFYKDTSNTAPMSATCGPGRACCSQRRPMRDGRDEDGHAVAAGLYFARLITAELRTTRTVVRVR